MKDLTYFVAFDIPAETQDDRKAKTQIIAAFRYPFEADDFITKCLPAENRNRFYIIHK